jgi:hypothetical protein
VAVVVVVTVSDCDLCRNDTNLIILVLKEIDFSQFPVRRARCQTGKEIINHGNKMFCAVIGFPPFSDSVTTVVPLDLALVMAIDSSLV